MDLQETIVLRIRRERGSHLATNYRPVGLQRTTHASSERHQWMWWTPSEMVSRLDLVVLEGGWMNISSTPLGFLEYLGIYRSKRRFGGTWGAHNTPGRAWASWRTLVGATHLKQPLRCFLGPLAFFWPNKSSKSCVAFGLRLILISCDVKNKQKTTTGTWHSVNRLVPKNDIKWL